MHNTLITVRKCNTLTSATAITVMSHYTVISLIFAGV